MRWLFLSLATLLVVEVFMSVSRAGILGLIASATIIVVELTRRRLGIRILVILLTISAAALLALSGVTGRLSVDLRLASLSGGSGRSAAWSWAVDQIGHRPPLGYGYGSSPDLFAKFSLLDSLSPVSAGFVGSYAGNVFIDIGLELGLFGIIAFLTACAIALRRMRVGLNPQRLRPGGLAGSACLAMFIGGVVDAQGESWVLAPGGVVTVAFWFALLFTAAAGYANMTWATRTGSAWTSNV
jgi:O-antigen ligase